MVCVCSATVPLVNSSAGLAELKRNHSVLFLIVHDEEVDMDWQGLFFKQAKDKALKAKFAFTTNPEIVEVRMCTFTYVIKDRIFSL